MPDWLPTTLTLLITLVTGGAFGAVINEFFRRRKERTRTIPLVELVNRNPLQFGLTGIELVRANGGAAVTDVRLLQLLLRNNSGAPLQNAHVQFKFVRAEEIVPSVTSPALSKADLIPAEPLAVQPPWNIAFRWKIPQFPDGDSITFGFQIVNPVTGNSNTLYEAFLESSNGNIVLEKTATDPLAKRTSFFSKAESWGPPVVALGAALWIGTLAFRNVWYTPPTNPQATDTTTWSRATDIDASLPSISLPDVEATVFGVGYKLRIESFGSSTGGRWGIYYRIKSDDDAVLSTAATVSVTLSSGDRVLMKGGIPKGGSISQQIESKAAPVRGKAKLEVDTDTISLSHDIDALLPVE